MNPTKKVVPALVLVALTVLSGCGGGGGGTPSTGGTGNNSGGNTNTSTPPISGTPINTETPPGTPAPGSGASSIRSLRLSPSNPTLSQGQTIVISALALDGNGGTVPVAAGNWNWGNSNNGVISVVVSNDRVGVTAVAPGTSVLTAREASSGAVEVCTVTVTAASSTPPNGNGTVTDGGTGSGSTGGTGTGVREYYHDFSTPVGSEWSPNRIDTTPGTSRRQPTAFLGQFGNETASLSLGNLAAHSSVTLEFDVFAIRSLDGNAATGDLGPDIWEVSIEGGPLLKRTTFSNITPSLATVGFPDGFFQSFPGDYPGGNASYQAGATEVGTLGYLHNGTITDAVYHLTFTFPHTADSVKFNFKGAGLQNIADESWGLKNVRVKMNP